jgi:hypothetical protein
MDGPHLAPPADQNMNDTSAPIVPPINTITPIVPKAVVVQIRIAPSATRTMLMPMAVVSSLGPRAGVAVGADQGSPRSSVRAERVELRRLQPHGLVAPVTAALAEERNRLGRVEPREPLSHVVVGPTLPARRTGAHQTPAFSAASPRSVPQFELVELGRDHPCGARFLSPVVSACSTSAVSARRVVGSAGRQTILTTC